MANRRMFARTITDSDAFSGMPLSAQALYFHLGMAADDDGFINAPKRIQRSIGAADDDLRLLVGKGFLIPFESGVVVVTHWKINNYLQKDRHTPTVYSNELAQLNEENRVYFPLDGACIQTVYGLDTQIRTEEKSKAKERKGALSGACASLVREVVEYLNQRTGKQFSPSAKATQRNIKARAAEGHELADFKQVIDNKAEQWLGSPEMAKYLRPETLFSAKHFESYLNEGAGLDVHSVYD